MKTAYIYWASDFFDSLKQVSHQKFQPNLSIEQRVELKIEDCGLVRAVLDLHCLPARIILNPPQSLPSIQILTGEDWNVVMYDGIQAYGGVKVSFLMALDSEGVGLDFPFIIIHSISSVSLQSGG